jgi:uncharacterized protein (DUF2267 family)
MRDIKLLKKNIDKIYEWIKDIEERLAWDDEDNSKALSVLRSTLHVLRDNIPLNNLANFSAQLPIVIRGLLFEGWQPKNSILKTRRKEDFLEHIFYNLPDSHRDINIEQAVIIVFRTLADKIDAQEIEKIKKVLPSSIREIM